MTDKREKPHMNILRGLQSVDYLRMSRALPLAWQSKDEGIVQNRNHTRKARTAVDQSHNALAVLEQVLVASRHKELCSYRFTRQQARHDCWVRQVFRTKVDKFEATYCRSGMNYDAGLDARRLRGMITV
jgi:hypothetical protein